MFWNVGFWVFSMVVVAEKIVSKLFLDARGRGVEAFYATWTWGCILPMANPSEWKEWRGKSRGLGTDWWHSHQPINRETSKVRELALRFLSRNRNLQENKPPPSLRLRTWLRLRLLHRLNLQNFHLCGPEREEWRSMIAPSLRTIHTPTRWSGESPIGLVTTWAWRWCFASSLSSRVGWSVSSYIGRCWRAELVGRGTVERLGWFMGYGLNDWFMGSWMKSRWLTRGEGDWMVRWRILTFDDER